MSHGRPRRVAAIAIAVLASGVPVAHAATTDMWLRVEGRTSTLYEGPLHTTDAAVDGADGTGPHTCQAGASPASALTASGLTWAGTWNPDFHDFFLDRVGPDASDPASVSYWSVLVDWRYANGTCRAQVPFGGEVLFAYGGATRLLRLTGPTHVSVDEPFTVAVRDGWIRATTDADGGPVAGASVGGATTGPDGTATLRFDTSGPKLLKADAPNAIRSNTLAVCVGDARCEGVLPPTPSPGPPGADLDSDLAITLPPDGERYAHHASTLLLLGRGPTPATVRFGGKTPSRCIELARPTRIASRPCTSQPRTLPATRRGSDWSYRLHTRLPPGSYQLTVTASGRTTHSRFTVAATPATVRSARQRADRWLRHAQHHDGGFGAHPGATSTPLFTDWATIALGHTREPGTAFRMALAQVRTARRATLASLQRAALALTPSHSERDHAQLRHAQAAIAARQRPNGSWNDNASASAYAVLSLRGSKHRRELRAGRRWLRKHARPLDTDTLGAVLGALGRDAPHTMVAHLRSLQNADGGYATRAGDLSNVQSTALAIIGLRAAGIAPSSWRANTGISGLDYLRARQRPSGRLNYALDDDRTPVWVTAQTLLALVPSKR